LKAIHDLLGQVDQLAQQFFSGNLAGVCERRRARL